MKQLNRRPLVATLSAGFAVGAAFSLRPFSSATSAMV